MRVCLSRSSRHDNPCRSSRRARDSQPGQHQDLELARQPGPLDLLHQDSPATCSLLGLRCDATTLSGAIRREHASHAVLAGTAHTAVASLRREHSHGRSRTTPRGFEIRTDHVLPLVLRNQATGVKLTQALGLTPILVPATLAQSVNLIREARLAIPHGESCRSKCTAPQRPIRRRLRLQGNRLSNGSQPKLVCLLGFRVLPGRIPRR